MGTNEGTGADEPADDTGIRDAGYGRAEEGQTEDDAGVLGRFPEAVDASRDMDGAPPERPGAAGTAFRVLLGAGMVVGSFAALALVSAVVLQGLLAGSYIRSGGDYFGAGPEGRMARELLGLPIDGFVAALLVSLAAICVGAYGVLRTRRAA